ncbi:MAG: hypothetical protein AAB432_02565 [Patescibacteria group bacterium]
MNKAILNPAQRGYEMSDRDRVFIKDDETSELFDVEVIGFENDNIEKPIFRVLSDGLNKGKVLYEWQVIFI